LNEIGAKVDNLLQDRTTSIVVSVVLALYAGLAAPKLPDVVVKFFDTMFGKVLFLFLIGFMASRNVQVALMIAVAYVVTLHIANKRATEEYINFLRRERFMNYYELFATEDEVKEKNKTALSEKVCAKVKELDGTLPDDKKILENNKLKTAHKDITVIDALKKINEALADDKKILKDDKLDMEKAMADGGVLKGIVIKKLDGDKEVDVATDKLAEALAPVIEVAMAMKLAEVCADLAPPAAESTEYFNNYENFEDEPETFEEDQPETFEEDNMMENYEDYEPETFEEDPETFEEADMAEGYDDNVPEGGEFYQDMEQFENFNVVPADNLNGNPNKMYAPVSF
jgi:hypothetical protein